MLLLATTSDIVRITTGNAADVDVYVSYVDLSGSTVTPGRQASPAITTATTATICAAPAASTVRNIKYINITNNHATASTTVDVEFFDGTNPTELRAVTLLPGENLAMDERATWHHRDIQNGEYTYSVTTWPNNGPTGTISETIPRESCPEVNTTAAASGTLRMDAIYLVAGQLVSNITIASATTAAGTPTNYFFALYDINRNLRAVSANQTTTAWPANTVKTLAMITPYRVPTSGLYYIGYMMTATTVATLKGGTAKTGAQLAGAVPILHGTSTTGLTTAMPDPAAAITVGTANIYAAVS
jgi:hypothetical protein